jgi:hypothetical protein
MSGCGVSGYGMSDTAAYPFTAFLEVARRAHRPEKAPRDQMECRLLEQDQALGALVGASAPAI